MRRDETRRVARFAWSRGFGCPVHSPNTVPSGKHSTATRRSWSGPDEHEILDEASQLELASELLAVSDEDELDRFLGDLIRKVARSVGSIVRSPLGKAIGNSLKSVIRTALPLAGGALGTLAGGPLGASIGSGLASMAGRAFGLELEGLSHEDRELAAANRFVRFASEAVNEAISAASVA